MKINNLFAKGLVITAISSSMILGVGVAGASASNDHRDRGTSSSEHRHGPEDDDDDVREDDDREDDDREDDDDRDDDGLDENGPSSSLPVVSLPVVSSPGVDVPAENARVTPNPTASDVPAPVTTVASFETPEVSVRNSVAADPTDFRATSPEIVPLAGPSAANQPQTAVTTPEVLSDVTSGSTLINDVEAMSVSAAAPETVPSEAGSLPMTGAMSLLMIGLAASLLAAGWFVFAARRRHDVA